MIKKYLLPGIALLACSHTVSALADETVTTPSTDTTRPSIFSVSAFGTIGVVQTNTNNGVFETGFQSGGATKTADFTPDTKAGAQVDAKFNEDFSATIQAFTRQNIVGSYEPDIEWAFAKLKLGGGFDLRLGRIGAPFFMSSDFRNVGYTSLTVRTPSDVYEAVTFRHFDGGDILYQGSYGDTTFNSQLWLGNAEVLAGNHANFHVHDIAGLNFSVENGPVLVRAGRMRGRMSIDGSGVAGYYGLLGDLNTVGALPGLESLQGIASDFEINGKFASFTGIGTTIDLTDWVFNAEVTKRSTESTYVPTETGWYTTLGYRIQKFTPYVLFSGNTVNSTKLYATPAVPSFYPPVVQGTVPALVTGVNGLITSQITEEKSSAIGVRWDVGKNYDIKAELMQVRVPAGSNGTFSNVVGGAFAVDTKVNVFSLCLDFVF